MSTTNTEEALRAEIKKWMVRLDDSLLKTRAAAPKGAELLTNAKAYQRDSLHFMEKGDLVRAFEALVWAWAWIEIGKQLELLA